jgi:hypothetical protein
MNNPTLTYQWGLLYYFSDFGELDINGEAFQLETVD